MTPEEKKNAAVKELARRELVRRQQVNQPREDYGSAEGDLGQFDMQNEASPNPVSPITGQPMENPFTLKTALDTGASVLGIRDATRTLLTGQPASLVGNVAGGIEMYSNPENPLAGPEARDRVTDALTIPPQTDKGRNIIQGLSELYNKYAAPYVDKIRLHEEVEAAGGPEWLQKNAAALPEYLGAATAGLGMRPTGTQPIRTSVPGKPTAAGASTRQNITLNRTDPLKIKPGGRIEPTLGDEGIIKQSILKGEANPKAAKFKLVKDPQNPTTLKLVDDEIAKLAGKQGWSDDVIITTKIISQRPADKAKALEMLQIARRAKRDTVWGADNRPTDVTGGSVMERFNALKNIQSRAGKQIDKVAANSLKRPVDANGIWADFKSKIEILGGKVNEKGDLEFGELSDIYAQPKNQKNLGVVLKRIEALGDNPSGVALHNTKRWLYDFVKYKNTGGKGGVTGDAENLIKGLANNINEKLKNISKSYDKVNESYSDVTGALDDMGDALGKTLYGENADKATGVTMRRWIGNAQSRIPIANSVRNAEKVLKKYNVTFQDDAGAQVLFANALDDYLTTPTNRTTAKAEMGKTAARAFEQSTAKNIVEGAGHLVDRAMGHTDDAAMNTLEDILRGAGN